jgi:rare lipoprotein A
VARSITKQRVRRGSRNDDKLIGQFALLRKMQEVGMVSRGKAAAVGMIALVALTACQQTPTPSSQAAQQEDAQQELPQEALALDSMPAVAPKGSQLDHSGRKQQGRASYYGQHFANRKLAGGGNFDPHSNVAASKTLPLGTTAKVTNLAKGKSATVVVGDRGPFIDGRVVDVTPKVASELEIRESGVAPVVVAPIAVPQADGTVKLGAGAAQVTPQEVARATKETAATTR